MAELNPVFLDALTYPAKDLRKILDDIYTEGILTSGALAVTQSGTPAMSVSVAAGRAIVTNDEGDFGKYLIPNDAAVTKTIAASDPSNPRIDRIIAQVYDSTDISGAVDEWALEVLTGTPAGSPAAPALPSNAISLATIAVAAGVTTIVNANITDTRTVLSIKANKIAEQDSGSGVTIDGILLKDDLDISGIVSKTTAQTLTNKRITKREITITSHATPTPTSDTADIYTITAQAEAAAFAAPSGTPTQGQCLLIRIKDNGTARALSWNAIYRAGDIALPTTTVLSKTIYAGLIYNSTDTKWDLVAYEDNY